MTVQRRRLGQTVEVYGRKKVTTLRGSVQWIVDYQSPAYVGPVWIVPDRSQRAEVKGQQEIKVYTMGMDDVPKLHTDETGLWTFVKWGGKMWDIIAPPLYHHGASRHTRHWTISIRERPTQKDESNG